MQAPPAMGGEWRRQNWTPVRPLLLVRINGLQGLCFWGAVHSEQRHQES